MSEAKWSMFSSRRHGDEDKKASTWAEESKSSSHKNTPADDGEDGDFDISSSQNNNPKQPRLGIQGWGTDGDADNTHDSKATSGGSNNNGDTTNENKQRTSRRRKGGENASVFGSSSTSDSKPKNKHFDDDNETTDIQEIPDLEEEEREPDITMQIAEAPRNLHRGVQTLKELDREIKFALPSSVGFGVDLNILTTVLCPEKAVLEDDDIWTFDSLLNEVAQEFQKDVDEKEELLRTEAGGAP